MPASNSSKPTPSLEGWYPFDTFLSRVRPWQIRVFVLALLGSVLLINWSRDHREKSVCPHYAQLCAMTFSGRVRKFDYIRGRLWGIKVRAGRKTQTFTYVHPGLSAHLELGDSIRKYPGSLHAFIRDAYGRWKQVQLFELPDTTGCAPRWPVPALTAPQRHNAVQPPQPISLRLP